jgi:hypothetical protein
MQTLGLSSESKRSDGWVKSLLWPTVENAWDVDYLGQQGMWICTAVAAFTLVVTLLTANPLFILVGLLSAIFFVLGGMGIRQGSWPAAAIVFVVYLLNSLAHLNVFSVIFSIVLLTNLRATFLASEWKPVGEDEDRPTRFNETLADKYVDQMPQLLWNKLQIPFIILGATMLLFSVAGLGIIVAGRLGLLPHK